jgi:hypothetical protein
VLKGIGIDTVISVVHHVIVVSREPKAWIGTGDQFQGFVATACGNYGVGRGDGWDDVLDYTLGQGIRDALDTELLRPLQGGL